MQLVIVIEKWTFKKMTIFFGSQRWQNLGTTILADLKKNIGLLSDDMTIYSPMDWFNLAWSLYPFNEDDEHEENK